MLRGCADRLTELDLPTLELRRLQATARLNLLLKIVFGLVKLKSADFFRVLICYKYERACI